MDLNHEHFPENGLAQRIPDVPIPAAHIAERNDRHHNGPDQGIWVEPDIGVLSPDLAGSADWGM